MQTHLENIAALEGVRQVLLFDPLGQPIFVTPIQEDVSSMGALVAGSFAAAQAMALVNLSEPYAQVHYESNNEQMLMVSLGNLGILVVVADPKLSVGFLKFHIRQIQPGLLEHLRHLRAQSSKVRVLLQDVSEQEIEGALIWQ